MMVVAACGIWGVISGIIANSPKEAAVFGGLGALMICGVAGLTGHM